MSSYNFDVVIPWHILQAHLKQQLHAADLTLRHAPDTLTMGVRQGRAQLLEELMNLPQTLELLALEDERVKAEKGK